MRYFFYGSLTDPDMLAVVLGSRATRGEPAALPGWRRVRAAGAAHPLLLQAPGEVVAGVVVDASAGEARRIGWYEERDDYATRELDVTLASGATARALVFLPRTQSAHDDEPWRPGDWGSQKSALLEAARRWMDGLPPEA